MPNSKILLVEDEPSLAHILTANLKKAGYDVVRASDGRRGLALCLEARPDVVLLDVVLPRLDGLEILRRLRAESQVPVICLSARKHDGDRLSALKLGADYLAKPFAFNDLLRRIEIAARAAATDAPPRVSRRRCSAGRAPRRSTRRAGSASR